MSLPTTALKRERKMSYVPSDTNTIKAHTNTARTMWWEPRKGMYKVQRDLAKRFREEIHAKCDY